ncbi:MAG: GGDEF domain-containing protein [Roseivivax sp.]|nr:GGDEF domain-containing protein [Roseivivax sp.]
MSDLSAILNLLCPMHARIDGKSRIVSVGPTLHKLRPDSPLPGRMLGEAFEVMRPTGGETVEVLLLEPGTSMRLRFRDEPQTGFKGIAVPDGRGGVLLDLSFGIALVEALQCYELTNADFAPTDLSIEMLYLIEAKSAAMDASRTLNRRLQVARSAAEEQAATDKLTGLKNRRALDAAMDRLIATDDPFAIMHLDLDHFKRVNDTLGHPAGDFVLQETTRRILRVIRESDLAARVGGDEFMLVFRNRPTSDRLGKIAERLITSLERPMLWGRQTCAISVSAGIAIRRHERESEALIARADAALYMAKRKGRAQYQFARD